MNNLATRGAEKGHLQAEQRALEDILANSPDFLLAVSFGCRTECRETKCRQT